MAGWKAWTRQVLSITDMQEYLQDQVVQRYASRAARTADGPAVLEDGMMSYLIDERLLEQVAAGAWRSPGPLGVVHYASQTAVGSSASTTPARITGTINGACTFYPGRLYRGKVRAQMYGTVAGDIGQAFLLISVGAATPTSSDPQVAAVNFHVPAATSGAVNNPVLEDLFTVPVLSTCNPAVWLKRLSGTGTVSVGPQLHGKWTVEVEDVGSTALRAERQSTNLGTILSVA